MPLRLAASSVVALPAIASPNSDAGLLSKLEDAQGPLRRYHESGPYDLDKESELDDRCEVVEDEIIATRAISAEDAAAQVLLACDLVDRIRDHNPTEQLVADCGASALRLLYSAVAALRQSGIPKVSDGVFDRYATDWRSP